MDDHLDTVTLAIALPGASGILRAAGINFQAERQSCLAAAQARGIALEPLLTRLRDHERTLLGADGDPARCAGALALLLTEACRLARGLEARFCHRPGCPNGLASALQDLAKAFSEHDAFERAAMDCRPGLAVRSRLAADHEALVRRLDGVRQRLPAPTILAGFGPTGQVLVAVWRTLDHDLRCRLAREDAALCAEAC